MYSKDEERDATCQSVHCKMSSQEANVKLQKEAPDPNML